MTVVVLYNTNSSPLWSDLKDYIFYVGQLENVFFEEEIESFENLLESLFDDYCLIIYLAQEDDWEGILIIKEDGGFLLCPEFLKMLLEVADYDLSLLYNKSDELRKFIKDIEIDSIIFDLEEFKRNKKYIRTELEKILKG